MTIVQEAHYDPRTYVPPPLRAKPERPPEGYRAPPPTEKRCDDPSCETRLEVSGVVEHARGKFLRDQGWRLEGGGWFCSEACARRMKNDPGARLRSGSKNSFQKVPEKGDPAHKHAGVSEVRCGYADCVMTSKVEEVSPERIPNHLETLGWQFFEGTWFCSKRCVALERLIVRNEKTGKDVPLWSKASQDLAHAPGKEPRKVPTVVVGGSDGIEHRFVPCCRLSCESRFEVPHGAAEELLVKMAAVQGWNQTDLGVFCSQECAKRHRDDSVAGILPRHGPVVAQDAPEEASKAYPASGISLSPEVLKALLEAQKPISPTPSFAPVDAPVEVALSNHEETPALTKAGKGKKR